MADPTQLLAKLLRSNPGLFFDRKITDFQPLHLNPEEFYELLIQHGEEAELRTAIRCPCARVETRGAAIGCDDCGGIGWFYPVDLRQQTIVLHSQSSARMQLRAAGLLADGSAYMTFARGIIPGRRDIVVMGHEETVVNEVVFRARQQIDPAEALARQTHTELLVPPRAHEDLLVYPRILKLEHLYYREGGHAVEAHEGRDFLLDGRRIEWLRGRGPRPNTAYTVRYQANAAYVVGDNVAEHRHEWVNDMPWRVRVERLDQVAERDLREVLS